MHDEETLHECKGIHKKNMAKHSFNSMKTNCVVCGNNMGAVTSLEHESFCEDNKKYGSENITKLDSSAHGHLITNTIMRTSFEPKYEHGSNGKGST